MSKYCPVTGKKPVSGNRVSHANNKTKRVFEPNMHEKRLWSPALGRFIRLRVSARGLRTIDKLGVDTVLANMKSQGIKF
ncbi:50S ribosomal protein L28 [Paludibaculum fermentans]|uniref:Large ribosomal subunit protein bL28 n=1 Tax=Paludibaculum fermentans TaxID=1473598 RepID=A0A7S7NPD4_PALFE|nr:50S ribosomal protein L28 [Paludibaculum fermentans]QOY87343.1 50S ribosomal protein L28 [Paludibaculum fermentans]